MEMVFKSYWNLEYREEKPEDLGSSCDENLEDE